MITVDDAILNRRSVRAFLPDPVSRETIEHILAVASRAPSGTNTQPWKAHVLTGRKKEALSRAILDAFYEDPAAHQNERVYYMEKWREPYVSRRRKVGWDMYGLVGVTREDKEGMRRQSGRNYSFFDAPVGMIFTIDQDMNWGSRRRSPTTTRSCAKSSASRIPRPSSVACHWARKIHRP